MKRILLFIIITLLTITAEAQVNTFVDAGLSGAYGSNQGKVSFPEIYGAAGVKLFEFNGSTIQARVKGRYAKTPEYADLFTRDNNPERIPTGELKVAPELRVNLSTESYFKPFIAGGFEYRYQSGLAGFPYSGMNPTLTFGTGVGYGYEIAYTRLLDDRFGSSKLRGDRLGASYLFKVKGKLHIKFGAEAERVSYRACSNKECDHYREYDWLARPFVGVSIY